MVVHTDYPMLARFAEWAPPESSDDEYFQAINYNEPEDWCAGCQDGHVDWVW